jgi:hypothetical protein
VTNLQSREQRRPAEVHTAAIRNQSPPVSHEGVEQQRAERRGERGCAIAIYRREGFRRTSPSCTRGSFTFLREPARATLPTRGRRRNRPACAACSRAPGKRTLAAFPGCLAKTPFLASRSWAPSLARCANMATCSPGRSRAAGPGSQTRPDLWHYSKIKKY